MCFFYYNRFVDKVIYEKSGDNTQLYYIRALLKEQTINNNSDNEMKNVNLLCGHYYLYF